VRQSSSRAGWLSSTVAVALLASCFTDGGGSHAAVALSDSGVGTGAPTSRHVRTSATQPRARATLGSGRLYAVQAFLYDCPDGCRGPEGFYRVWGGPPRGVLRKLRGVTDGGFTTPLPATISPNRRWVVHARRGRAIVLRRLGAIGRRVGPVRRVLRRPGGAMPLVTWSADSRRLLLNGYLDRRLGLWTMNRDGSSLRRIPLPRAVVPTGEAASWASTGRIAFPGQTRMENNRGSLTSRIYVVWPDGSGLAAVTNPRRGKADTAPAWSPAGRKLAYVHDAVDVQGQLRILDPDTGTRHLVDRRGGAAAWSPNGRWLAYDSRDGAFLRLSSGRGSRRDLQFGSADIKQGWLDHFDWARK
jgi:hypothetical protein